jgi:DNA repair protein REV1
MVVSHGGGFLQYLDGKTMVTHIIASNLTPKKALEFKAYRIVKPAWVVDSIQAGRLMPWTSYRAVDDGPRQKVLGFDDGKMVHQQSDMRRGYKEQTDASWYTLKEKEKQEASSMSPGASKASSFFSNLDDSIFDGVNAADFEAFPKESMSLTSPNAMEESMDDIEDDNVMPSPKVADSPMSIDAQHDQLEENTVLATTPTTRASPLLPKTRPESPIQEHELEDVKIESPSRANLTAEEHNAILLADPQVRKSTVTNPDFLEQYYRESRLHHLSAWKADLKTEMQALADTATASQKNERKPKPGTRRYILHVDFDCFFAAVSIKKYPQYKDVPAVVAHGSGSGSEIASCNYHAREFGIKNGMWMRRVQELCPQVKTMPYDFPGYEAASRQFYDCIIATRGIVQSVSVDEALIDITAFCLKEAGTDGISRAESSVEREQAVATGVGNQLREQIKAATDCDVSVGIGGNILLAKLALRNAKPAGLYHLLPDDVLDFLEPLEVGMLPGFAYHMVAKLEQIDIKYVRDVRATSKEKLITTLGPKTGEKLWEYARGIDRKEVGDVEVRKSVSAEVNWGVRFENQDQVDEFIASLCTELQKRLLKEKVRGKQLTLKIMKRSADAPLDPPKHLGHGLCDTFNKSTALGIATNGKEALTREALQMLRAFGFSPGELRGIGVQMTKLEPCDPNNAETSQKLLQFKPLRPNAPQPDFSDDPIEDKVTPKKQHNSDTATRVRFGAEQLNEFTPSRKLLNTRGTQFILPSQFDPQVLKELPSDVRSKLIDAQKKSSKPQLKTPSKQRSTPNIFTSIPNKSQIDPETFAALPSDMQSEILAFYDSPINDIAAFHPREKSAGLTTPKAVARSKDRTPKSKASTLTQSNFITSHFSRSNQTDQATDQTDSDVPPISPTYLAALPTPLRAEVLAEHNRKVIRAKNRKLAAEKRHLELEAKKLRPPRRKLVLPPLEGHRPTFTRGNLCTVDELRRALGEWIQEFAKEGPYEEDAEALGVYLAKVVSDERDMSKATDTFRWLKWCVEELDTDHSAMGKKNWESVLDNIRAKVQASIKERGLGHVRL